MSNSENEGSTEMTADLRPKLGKLLEEAGMGTPMDEPVKIVVDQPEVPDSRPAPFGGVFIDGHYYYRHSWEDIDRIKVEDLYARINLVMGNDEHVTLVGACLPIAGIAELRDFLMRELSKAQAFRTGVVEFLMEAEEEDTEALRGYCTTIAYISLDKIIGITMEVFHWPEGYPPVPLRVLV